MPSSRRNPLSQWLEVWGCGADETETSFFMLSTCRIKLSPPPRKCGWIFVLKTTHFSLRRLGWASLISTSMFSCFSPQPSLSCPTIHSTMKWMVVGLATSTQPLWAFNAAHSCFRTKTLNSTSWKGAVQRDLLKEHAACCCYPSVSWWFQCTLRHFREFVLTLHTPFFFFAVRNQKWNSSKRCFQWDTKQLAV